MKHQLALPSDMCHSAVTVPVQGGRIMTACSEGGWLGPRLRPIVCRRDGGCFMFLCNAIELVGNQIDQLDTFESV